MKIALTIKKDYLGSWGVWEGIRELVQNGRDAEVEFDAPLTVDFVNGTLRIENDGAVLSREALLLGHSSKATRSDLIGKFGEGLKLGLLALVRQGLDVKIRSGSEVWVPRIERSEQFDAEVLVVQILTGREEKKRVRVEIGGGKLDKEVWTALKDRFRFLHTKDKSIQTESGTLLLDEALRGRIYVKGIFVQVKSGLEYGYDLADASLDRDRKMVEHWDLQYRLQKILQAASSQLPDKGAKLFTMLEQGSKDTEGFESTSYIVPSLAQQVAAKFQEKFGQDAVPVRNLEESKDLEHLGKKGVVVTPALGQVLSIQLGSIDTIKSKLKEEVVTRYSYSDLTVEEKASLEDAIALTKIGAEVSLADVDVVDFRSSGLLGQFKEGRYLLAKRILADRDETLATLVHEVAHHGGGDGEKGHIEQLERIWTKIVSSLRKR